MKPKTLLAVVALLSLSLMTVGLVTVGLVTVGSPLANAADDQAKEKAAASPLEGHWAGTLKVGVIELRLALRFTKDSKGALKGVMDSIDQGAKDIPIESITVSDRKVELDLKKIGGKFTGELSKDGAELSGEWLQGGTKFPLAFKRTKEALSLIRPQEPKKPYPYQEEEVVVDNAKAGVKLAGTLTLPKGQGPFPAVFLITGSGAQDRNEELLGHKPFLVIADYLTRRGVAVLRVDDRGVGKSTGKFTTATSEDFGGDALACVAYLKGRKEIRPRQIGLIGHSEGGLIAPWAAARSSDVAFIVLLAGPGVTGEEILYSQGEAILKAAKVPEAALAQQRRVQENMFAILKAEKDDAAAERKLREFLEGEIAKLPEAERKEAEKQKGMVDAQIKQVLGPWFRHFLSYDPQPALRMVKCPLLAITGERDLQVLPQTNLRAIETALRDAGHKDYTVKELPKLNHLFQTCETGSPSEYGKIEETFSPAALAILGDWIAERTKKGE